MTDKKKLWGIAVLSIGLILLAVLWIFSESLVIHSVAYAYLKVLHVILIVWLFKKFLKNYITQSLNKSLAICAAAMLLDFVVLGTIRFYLSNGSNIVLLLPACLPICIMSVAYYYFKETGSDKNNIRKMFLICIPLLALSIYFEVLSFIDV